MRRIYDRELIGRSLTGVAATLSIIIVVFLAEQLTTLVETLVENRMSFDELPWVLLLTAPGIVGTAAPLAMLIGAYRALIDARDANETVAMAGAGVGPLGLLGSFLGLAAVMAVAVVAVVGFLDPASRAVRDRLFLEAARQLTVAAIRDGLEPDLFRTINGYTFVSPSLGDPSRRRLLIFFPRDARGERIVATEHYDLTEEQEKNNFRLHLDDVVVADVGVAAGASASGGEASRGSGLRLGSVTRDIDLDEVLRDPRLANSLEYRTLSDLARSASEGDGPRRPARTRAVEIVARSTLSIAAVLIAAISVSFAAGNLRFVTLPAGGVLLIVLDLGVVRVVRGLYALPSAAYLAIVAATVLGTLTVLGIAAAGRFSGVLAPPGGRG